MTNPSGEWPRRNPLLGACLGGGLGLLALFSGLNRPTIANMRKIDLVHLLATGALFGVALMWVVLYFRLRRKG